MGLVDAPTRPVRAWAIAIALGVVFVPAVVGGAVAGDATQTQSDVNVTIELVHEDAAGSEYDNLNDEYVVLANHGDTTAAIGRWTLSDDDGHTYVVPESVVLDPGANVTIHTGVGTDNATDLYWGRGAPVWNNGGDLVILRDDTGAERDRVEYGHND